MRESAPPVDAAGCVLRSHLYPLVTGRSISIPVIVCMICDQPVACSLLPNDGTKTNEPMASRQERGASNEGSNSMRTPPTNCFRGIASMCPFSTVRPADVYARYREPQQVICPEDHEYATVQVDAEMAAATAALGMPGLRIIRCSQWPRECGRGCLELLS